MVREGENSELVNLVHTMSNPPMIKAGLSIIRLQVRDQRGENSNFGMSVGMNFIHLFIYQIESALF